MITVEELRKEYELDTLRADEIEVLAKVEELVREAAKKDRDHVVYDVTEESYPKYFILNTRVGNLLTDAGYRIGLVKKEKADPTDLSEPQQYGCLISFAGNR